MLLKDTKSHLQKNIILFSYFVQDDNDFIWYLRTHLTGTRAQGLYAVSEFSVPEDILVKTLYYVLQNRKSVRQQAVLLSFSYMK